MKCDVCNYESERIVAKITDGEGSYNFCPNCLVLRYAQEQLDFENHPDFIDDVTGEKGAVKFESYDEVYILEKDRMLRLIARNLEPEEYFALVKKYGANKYLLHDDFYDPFDGAAIQPVTVD